MIFKKIFKHLGFNKLIIFFFDDKHNELLNRGNTRAVKKEKCITSELY